MRCSRILRPDDDETSQIRAGIRQPDGLIPAPAWLSWTAVVWRGDRGAARPA